mmetsp:Transcript_5323/g.14702  ORF Transcript_5323/g.14702 Transcript_5323/m.14702 type:complete len:388 (-) Transcript_5323:90-1253(-)
MACGIIEEARPSRMSLQARFGKILQVTTWSNDSVSGHGSASPSGASTAGPKGGFSSGRTRCIKLVDKCSDFYELGREVMPSTHSYMQVKFATRRKDGAEVVIKVREKPQCFRSREDERSWRYNTEFLLNLPDNCGVVKLHEVLEDPQVFFVVMEKVQGMDLFETLDAEGAMTLDTVRDILRQLLSSLSHLHAHNAVHKDLKLENVMVDCTPTSRGDSKQPSPNSVKVIDFDTLEEWTPSSPTSKDVVGTDQYISQEAYAGKYSPLSDIFAAGVIAYRLLSGKFPFHDDMFDDQAGENWVGSPKMAQIRRRLKIAKIDLSHAVFRDNPEACDLVTRMLSCNELERPTASAALEHPFLHQAECRGKAFVPACFRSDSEDLIDDGIIIAE